jgi:hypothetical protein
MREAQEGMLKPSEEVVRAIANLSSSPAFDTLLAWIRESLITQAVKNTHNTGEVAIKLAGGCIELEQILSHVNKVPEYVNRYRELK